MSRKTHIRTAEENAVVHSRYKRLTESTTRTILRGLGALDRGEDMEAAMRDYAPEDLEFVEQTEEPRALADLVVGRLRHDGWTAQRQRDFLIELAACGSISQACARVGKSRQSAYELRNRAPNSLFAIGWDVAVELARKSLIDEAMDRALNGHEIETIYRGEPITRVTHNDRLLMFLIALKREPIHPVLTPRELETLWPTILEQVDAILPHPLGPARLAELGIDSSKNRNDGE